MSRFRVQILAAAEIEFRDAFHWYAERSALAADAFRAEVLDKVDGLARDADGWPSDDDGLRRRVLTRFPYTIFYDLTGDVVTVLAIAHQRRAPGYWRPR